MEKEQKVKKPGSKDSLIIGIVIAVVLILTAAIVAYVFWGVNSEVLVHYKGGEITRGKYESVYRYWAPTLSYYGYNPDNIPELVIDEILLNEVLYKEAVEAGAKISDEDQKSINEQFTDKENLEGLVAQGVDVDELKAFFEKNAVITAYLDAKQDKVTTEEIKQFIIQDEGEDADLNLYKTRHILFAFKADMTDADKAKLLKEAQDVLAKVKKGGDFAKLAAEHSDDGSAQNGGQFDMANNQTVVKAYRDAVVKLKAGQVADKVVETEYGYHIIKLDSVEKNGRLTAEDEISKFINAYISDRISEVFDPADEESKKELEAVKELSLRVDNELGIIHEESEVQSVVAQ
ncbi:MAG: peptidylprolyl isomerase [Clostridia bacterium]|nr:peptidylprolyl isomerase [Clostridia bacterium]